MKTKTFKNSFWNSISKGIITKDMSNNRNLDDRIDYFNLVHRDNISLIRNNNCDLDSIIGNNVITIHYPEGTYRKVSSDIDKAINACNNLCNLNIYPMDFGTSERAVIYGVVWSVLKCSLSIAFDGKIGIVHFNNYSIINRCTRFIYNFIYNILEYKFIVKHNEVAKKVGFDIFLPRWKQTLNERIYNKLSILYDLSNYDKDDTVWYEYLLRNNNMFSCGEQMYMFVKNVINYFLLQELKLNNNSIFNKRK